MANGLTPEVAKALADARKAAYKAKKDNCLYTESVEATVEQEVTDIEIAQMEQEQAITDHDIAIMELQEVLQP